MAVSSIINGTVQRLVRPPREGKPLADSVFKGSRRVPKERDYGGQAEFKVRSTEFFFIFNFFSFRIGKKRYQDL